MNRLVLVATVLVLVLLGTAFAVLAGTAVGILVTHTYRFKEYSLFVSLFAVCLAYFSFAAAGRIIRRRRQKI